MNLNFHVSWFRFIHLFFEVLNFLCTYLKTAGNGAWGLICMKLWAQSSALQTPAVEGQARNPSPGQGRATGQEAPCCSSLDRQFKANTGYRRSVSERKDLNTSVLETHAWWSTPKNVHPRKSEKKRTENRKFEGSLDYTERPCVKTVR